MTILEFWRRNGQGLAAALILSVCAAFYYHPRPPVPFKEVAGTYSNSCCEPVRLVNGGFWIGNHIIPIKLLKMKFGLVAESDKDIRVSGNQIVVIDGSNPYGEIVLFDADHQGFTLIDDHTAKYHFIRH